jgi:hypothetical protein
LKGYYCTKTIEGSSASSIPYLLYNNTINLTFYLIWTEAQSQKFQGVHYAVITLDNFIYLLQFNGNFNYDLNLILNLFNEDCRQPMTTTGFQKIIILFNNYIIYFVLKTTEAKGTGK